jgi:integrase
MSDRYWVKLIVLSDGERFPLLMSSEGQPLYEPTVYVLTELRSRNQATHTIINALRALMVFFLFLALRRICIEDRLCAGQLLSLDEVEDLVRLSRLPVKGLSQIMDEADRDEVAGKTVISLEKYRMKLTKEVQQDIAPTSASTRLRSIRDYLSWLATCRLLKPGTGEKLRDSLESSKALVVSAINARLPKGGGFILREREGLAPEQAELLLSVIDPLSPDNPWRGNHTVYRNELIVLWLYHLGLRRGELLGIRISEIDFRKGTVVVARRADDLHDPRRNQPNVKTRAREIPLSSGLLEKTSRYILNYRSSLAGAKQHDFLFVSSEEGAPLSIPSLAKIFNVLRKNCPELPKNLSPHVLRHTWNDRFSEEMDKRGVAEETEKKTRSYLMGWSETSGTAAIYTRRHVRKKAQEASLEMQNKITEG